MKTGELISPALDWAVAKCEGAEYEDGLLVWYDEESVKRQLKPYPYSTDWSQGGPIIERAQISTIRCANKVNGVWTVYWEAAVGFEDEPGHGIQYGPTPLIAAMRCYVASKLGDEVPDRIV